MSVYDSFPCKKNHPRPTLDPSIPRELREIGGLTPAGLPIFRVVWGQSEEHMWYGVNPQGVLEIAHRYRHRWEREYKMAEPVYNLDGQFQGYDRMFGYQDVLPAAVIPLLVPIEIKKSIGVPRWYFEIAMPIDPAEWDEKTQGPLPEGLVEYFPLIVDGRLMRIEDHSTDMVKVGTDTIARCCLQKQWEGKTCYGKYREPRRKDVEMVRAAWKLNQQHRPNNYAFDAMPSADRIRQLSQIAWNDFQRNEAKETQKTADDMEQGMTCLSESRAKDSDVPRADLQKYHVLGVKTTSAGDNHSRKPNVSTT